MSLPDLDLNDLQACARVLDALAGEPTLLATLDRDLRARILAAAGRVARLDPTAKSRLRKAMRRKDRRLRREHDARIVAATELRRSGAHITLVALPDPSTTEPATEKEYAEDRSCYVCKALYRRAHFFYHQMCPACAELNYVKRRQTADLRGRHAVITGARLKIGFQASLMLLRAGATVVATTRFPHDAARRYAAEPDFAAWGDRLRIHGLDLRHAPSVELFADHLAAHLPRLDFLINNAAQTVRRPPGFYAHMLPGEEAQVDPRLRPLLAAHEELCTALVAPGRAAAGLTDAARLTQLAVSPEDTLDPSEIFPAGRIDPDLQQLDLRRHNSWRMTLAEVPAVELIEVHLVNSIAPFLLASRLKPLMTRERTNDKHIVNVSAMEAQFARKKKTDKHPHTNMAKAALNMMTRTSAADYAEHGIFMNSVDTGWITDEDPLQHVARKQREHEFFPPLDAIDGAARVMDPIFSGLATGEHVWGKFFKDYKPTAW